MSSDRRRDSQTSRPPSGPGSRRVSWTYPVISQDSPTSSRPSSQGHRQSGDSASRVSRGGNYHYTGSRPQNLSRQDSYSRRDNESPGTPTSPYGSRGRYPPRRSSTTDYFSSPLGSPNATRDPNSRRNSRSGSISNVSPRGSETPSPAADLWSITFDCAKLDSEEDTPMVEYRVWFLRGSTLDDVINYCHFTDKQLKQAWSNGPVDSKGNEVFVLHKECGDTADGHADCHLPVDPRRFTDRAISDPKHDYLIRRCVPSEEDQDDESNSARHIIYANSKYTLGSADWVKECQTHQKSNREQRESYHHSMAKNAVSSRRDHHSQIEASVGVIENYSTRANSRVDALSKYLEDVLPTLANGTNDEQVRKIQASALLQLDELRPDFDSMRANEADILHSNEQLKNIDYHLWHVDEAQKRTIHRLRSERNDAEHELRNLKDRRRRPSNA